MVAILTFHGVATAGVFNVGDSWRCHGMYDISSLHHQRNSRNVISLAAAAAFNGARANLPPVAISTRNVARIAIGMAYRRMAIMAAYV